VNRPVLVCGLEHLLPKTARRYSLVRKRTGVPVVIYSTDVSGLSRVTADEYSIPWVEVPRTKIGELSRYVRLLIRLRVRHVELYHSTQSTIAHFMYIALACLARIPLVTVCRGNEILLFDRHVWRRRQAIRFGLKASTLVVYNQLHMPKTFDRIGIAQEKRLFFSNEVPYNPEEPMHPKERPGVLFLNTWHPWRHPELMVEIGIRLARKFPGADFILAGDRDPRGRLRKEFEERILSAGVADRFELLPYVDRPEELYRKANLFVLPAEIVFLNFSLLEAMERGLAPIIARVDGAARIVEHGVSGLIVDLDSEKFVQAVESLLSRPEVLENLCAGARKRIKEKFDLEQGIGEIIAAYETRVWRSHVSRQRAGAEMTATAE
jgi:glycosyltransferase involved in cell wall biosynthesis